MKIIEKAIYQTKTGVEREGVNEFVKSLNLGIDCSDFEWFNTKSKNHIPNTTNSYSGIANIHKINHIQRINKFFEEVNRKLEKGQYFLICVETKNTRKRKILNNYPKLVGYSIYFLDFTFKRVLPKLSLTKKIYFWFTKGNNRVLSLTESLGRLVSCGFDIIGYQRIGFTTYILGQKQSYPAYDLQPTYEALVQLKRIGYQGKKIKLYKLRTMHPYSEYLQEYIFNKNGTSDGDKIIGDFRVTNWGKIFRKFWIDELPMIWNLIKGDLKLVGVRPLSEHKFYTYPEYLRNKRTKVKPGLIPPYYVHLPKTPEEFFDAEEIYLNRYIQKPIRTDIEYFLKALYNIFIKKARSN